MIEPTIEKKVADFFAANFELSDNDEKESAFIAAVSRQLGGIVAYLGGPTVPRWAAQVVFDEILSGMREGFDEARELMKTAGKGMKQ